MINSYFDKDKNLYHLNLSGEEFILDNIKSHYEILKNSKDLPKHLHVLIDARDAHFNIDINDLPKTLLNVKEVCSKFDSLYEAIIISNPYEMVVATLFQKQNKPCRNYHLEIFSTIEYASRWLQIVRQN